MFLLLRRYIFVLVVIMAIELIFVQIWVMYFTCFVQAIYLLHFRPFVEPRMLNNLEVFNEVCSMFILYSFMSFSKANLFFNDFDEEDWIYPNVTSGEREYDLMYLSVVGVNLFVQLSLLLFTSLYSLKRCCRRSKKVNPDYMTNKQVVAPAQLELKEIVVENNDPKQPNELAP